MELHIITGALVILALEPVLRWAHLVRNTGFRWMTHFKAKKTNG